MNNLGYNFNIFDNPVEGTIFLAYFFSNLHLRGFSEKPNNGAKHTKSAFIHR